MSGTLVRVTSSAFHPHRKERQHLYFCTSKAEVDADVRHVGAGGKREQGGGHALRGAPQR
jgi:hypothetical protein